MTALPTLSFRGLVLSFPTQKRLLKAFGSLQGTSERLWLYSGFACLRPGPSIQTHVSLPAQTLERLSHNYPSSPEILLLAMKAVLFFALAAGAGAMELTKADWDEATSGKTVFLKFFAPWCGHCKSMKPAWDKLMAEYAGHASTLIADVDCTAAGKPLCDEVGVQGFPAIKHGDPNNLEDYKGGRDFDALSKFAKDNLGPSCGPDNMDLCDKAKKKQISDFMAMPIDALKAKITEQDDAMAAAEKELEELLKSLQKQYEDGTKAKDAKKDEIKESGLGLMKSVQAHRKNTKKEL